MNRILAPNPPLFCMYFWRIENLKNEMATRPLSDREVLPYFVAFVVLSAFVINFPQILFNTSDGLLAFNTWDGLLAVLSIFLTFAGTIYIYLRNGGNQGRHFLQRYFSIGWVVMLRLSAAVAVCAVVFFALLEFVFSETITDATAWYDFVILAVAEVCYYWRIAHHVHDVSQRVAPAKESPLV